MAQWSRWLERLVRPLGLWNPLAENFDVVPVFCAELVEALLKLGITTFHSLVELDSVPEKVIESAGCKCANQLHRRRRKVPLAMWRVPRNKNVRTRWKLIHLVHQLDRQRAFENIE